MALQKHSRLCMGHINQLPYGQLSEAKGMSVAMIGLEAKGHDYETQALKACLIIYLSVAQRAKWLCLLA